MDSNMPCLQYTQTRMNQDIDHTGVKELQNKCVMGNVYKLKTIYMYMEICNAIMLAIRLHHWIIN